MLQTDGSVPNTLVIANCEVVKPRVAAAEHISQVGYARIWLEYFTLVKVLIWDVEAQPNRHPMLGAAESRPDLVIFPSSVHYDEAFYPSCIHLDIVLPIPGKDKSVVLWSIHDHISSVAESTSKSPASASNSSGKQSIKAGNEKSSDSTTVGPRGVYQGHEDTVEDVQFCPSRWERRKNVLEQRHLIHRLVYSFNMQGTGITSSDFQPAHV
ncbi:hypothetical protein B296_00036818 [Ensete ventricosum]|uniref:Uncharacterized protein n=1 Tax=Ensete ventricosum TaxID=4639 RepID=A0A427A1E6_ENSVE|nr:hypothetical protein B296_00036818 [Ensete ventricosum]